MVYGVSNFDVSHYESVGWDVEVNTKLPGCFGPVREMWQAEGESPSPCIGFMKLGIALDMGWYFVWPLSLLTVVIGSLWAKIGSADGLINKSGDKTIVTLVTTLYGVQKWGMSPRRFWSRNPIYWGWLSRKLCFFWLFPSGMPPILAISMGKHVMNKRY